MGLVVTSHGNNHQKSKNEIGGGRKGFLYLCCVNHDEPRPNRQGMIRIRKQILLAFVLLVLLPGTSFAFHTVVGLATTSRGSPDVERTASAARTTSTDRGEKDAEWNQPSSGSGGYTLEYSPNFRRHIVRKGGVVIRSYAWFDEALQAFPHAERLPVPLSAKGDALPIAGGGTKTTQALAYSNRSTATLQVDSEANAFEMQNYLGETLGWYTGQIQTFLDACPFLVDWPVSLLRLQNPASP